MNEGGMEWVQGRAGEWAQSEISALGGSCPTLLPPLAAPPGGPPIPPHPMHPHSAMKPYPHTSIHPVRAHLTGRGGSSLRPSFLALLPPGVRGLAMPLPPWLPSALPGDKAAEARLTPDRRCDRSRSCCPACAVGSNCASSDASSSSRVPVFSLLALPGAALAVLARAAPPTTAPPRSSPAAGTSAGSASAAAASAAPTLTPEPCLLSEGELVRLLGAQGRAWLATPRWATPAAGSPAGAAGGCAAAAAPSSAAAPVNGEERLPSRRSAKAWCRCWCLEKGEEGWASSCCLPAAVVPPPPPPPLLPLPLPPVGETSGTTITTGNREVHTGFRVGGGTRPPAKPLPCSCAPGTAGAGGANLCWRLQSAVTGRRCCPCCCCCCFPDPCPSPAPTDRAAAPPPGNCSVASGPAAAAADASSWPAAGSACGASTWGMWWVVGSGDSGAGVLPPLLGKLACERLRRREPGRVSVLRLQRHGSTPVVSFKPTALAML